jgi:hypothetical protein
LAIDTNPDADLLFVADKANNRIYVFEGVGQYNANNLPQNPVTPFAEITHSSLNGPIGIYLKLDRVNSEMGDFDGGGAQDDEKTTYQYRLYVANVGNDTISDLEIDLVIVKDENMVELNKSITHISTGLNVIQSSKISSPTGVFLHEGLDYLYITGLDDAIHMIDLKTNSNDPVQSIIGSKTGLNGPIGVIIDTTR